MSKKEVQCRSCGHHILAREIMRTDLYERAPGQNYVYVKFRCRLCKRLGQTFVPEARWDWTLLEPARDELSEVEREQLGHAGPISETELLDFVMQLKNLRDWPDLRHSPKPPVDGTPASEKPATSEAPRLNLKSERKDEKRKDPKSKDDSREERLGSNATNPHKRKGTSNDARPEDSGSNG